MLACLPLWLVWMEAVLCRSVFENFAGQWSLTSYMRCRVFSESNCIKANVLCDSAAFLSMTAAEVTAADQYADELKATLGVLEYAC